MDQHVTPIRWGIAATGKIASQFASAFGHLDDQSELVAVGSRTAATARQFATAHGLPTAHPSYQALADDPGIDAVYIASLQPGHVSDALTFLNAGKHVLVEKPMALSAGEADQMIAAAQANNRFLMEAMWMRFNPGPVAAVDLITSGAIGAIRSVTADFSIVVPDDPEHRLRSLAKGGGALLDLGIYPLNLAWWLLGPPREVTAEGTVTGGVDSQCTITAAWPDCTATLTSGLDTAGSLTATVEGTHGTVTLNAPFHATSEVTMTDRHGSSRLLTTAGGSLHYQVAEVNRCLAAGQQQSDRNPWATSRDILAVCDQIRASLGVRYPSEGSGQQP